MVARAQAGRLMQAKSVKVPERDELAAQLASAGYHFQTGSAGPTMGMNVAGSKKGVDDAFVGLMKLARCKTEMLDSKYLDLGVGVVKGNDDEVYVVQVFSAKRKR
jgi:uncharacterized protein YkwD